MCAFLWQAQFHVKFCFCPEGFGGSPFLDCFPLNSTERILEPVTDIDTEPNINADELVTENDFQIDTGNDIGTEMGSKRTTATAWMENITETSTETGGFYWTTDQYFAILETTTGNNDNDDDGDSHIMVITESDGTNDIDDITTETIAEAKTSSTELNDQSTTTTDEYSTVNTELNIQSSPFPVYIPKITTEYRKPMSTTDSYRLITDNVLKIAPKPTTQMKPEDGSTERTDVPTQEISTENTRDFSTTEIIEEVTTDISNVQSDATTIGDVTTTATFTIANDDRIGGNVSTEIYVSIENTTEMSAVAA